MGYFVSESRLSHFNTALVEEIRVSAPVLGDRFTLNYKGPGSYYFEVENPLIGERFSFLPDVSLIDFGGTPGIALSATYVTAYLYQVFEVSDAVSDGRLTFRRNAAAFSQEDSVLKAQYPNYIHNNSWDELVVAPGESGSGFYPEFYLEVTVEPAVDLNAYFDVGQLPNAGRALVVRGDPGGERNKAWGNWLDSVNVPVDGPNLNNPPEKEIGQPLEEGGTSNIDPTLPPPIQEKVWDDTPLPFPEDFSPKNSFTWSSEPIQFDFPSSDPGMESPTIGQRLKGFLEETSSVVYDIFRSYMDWKDPKGPVNKIHELDDIRRIQDRTLDLFDETIKAYDANDPEAMDRAFEQYEDYYQEWSIDQVPIVGRFFNRFSQSFSQSDVMMNFHFGSDIELGGHRDTFFGANDRNVVSLGSKNDVAFGAGGNDRLNGQAGSDHLSGGAGNDVLIGGSGRDYLNGDAGNDVVIGGRAADTMFGGGGIDTLDYSNSRGGVSINLHMGVGKGGDAKGDRFSQFEGIIGSKGKDDLVGGIDNNKLFGGRGHDSLNGRQGNDVLIGGSGNDLIIGGAGDDRLLGKSGSDVFIFGSGRERIVGGGGRDTVKFKSDFDSYDITLGGAVTLVSEGDRSVIIGVERLIFDDSTFLRHGDEWTELG